MCVCVFMDHLYFFLYFFFPYLFFLLAVYIFYFICLFPVEKQLVLCFSAPPKLVTCLLLHGQHFRKHILPFSECQLFFNFCKFFNPLKYSFWKCYSAEIFGFCPNEWAPPNCRLTLSVVGGIWHCLTLPASVKPLVSRVSSLTGLLALSGSCCSAFSASSSWPPALPLGPRGSVIIHVLITPSHSSLTHLSRRLPLAETSRWRPPTLLPRFNLSQTHSFTCGWFTGISSSCVLTGFLMLFLQICASACILFPG